MQKFAAREHKTHGDSLWKFLALVALLGAYFIYMSWKFDAVTGAWLALLSWSFFVLCTPVADGGFLIDFPLRLLFGTRMIITEAIVWSLALGINIFALMVVPQVYDDAMLTRLLKTILTTPWPYWSIIVISAIGTFLSIWFADEMMDVTSHSKREKHHAHGFKYKIILVLGLGVLTVLAYYQVLSDLGVEVPTG